VTAALSPRVLRKFKKLKKRHRRIEAGHAALAKQVTRMADELGAAQAAIEAMKGNKQNRT